MPRKDKHNLFHCCHAGKEKNEYENNKTDDDNRDNEEGIKKEGSGVKIGENAYREKEYEKEKETLEENKEEKNEGVEVEEMEEKDGEEGVGRTSMKIYMVKKIIFMIKGGRLNNADQINTISVSTSSSSKKGNQAEQEGEEYPQLYENNDSSSSLIEESSVSQQGIFSQPIDLTGGEETFTSPPLCRLTKDKHMSLQAIESYQTKDVVLTAECYQSQEIV
eukprot:13603001-Ditylum_brightwellii.AAC.1